MLRDFLLLAVVAGFFLYGFHLMKRVDGFFTENRKTEKQTEKKQDCAVLFGEKREPELEKWFRTAGFQVIFTDDVQIAQEWGRVKYLVAYGTSDVDNLSMCSLFRKAYPKAEIYSVCNERPIKKLYRQTGTSIVYNKEELLQRMELVTLEHEVGGAA